MSDTSSVRSSFGKYTATEKLNAFSRLHLEWSIHLKPSELVLLGWIMANTTLRGRKSGSYSLTQFVDGVPHAHGGGMWAEGCGLTRRTVQAALKSLIGKKLLAAAKGRYGTIYEINLEWSAAHDTIPHKRNNVVPFPIVSGQNSPEAKGAEIAPTGGKICSLSRGIKQKEDVFTPSAKASEVGGSSLKELVHRETPIASGKKKPDNALGYQQTWLEAHKENGIPAVGWSIKTQSMVKKALANWPERVGDRHQFIIWCVSNWNAAIGAQMSWMTKVPPPKAPAPEFFGNFQKYFIAAYLDAERTRWIGTLPETQQAVERKVRQGMSHEGAALEVAKEQAVVLDRDRRAKDIRRAEETYQMAKMAADRAQRPAFGKDNPHPRAHENVPKHKTAVKTDEFADGKLQLSAIPSYDWDAE